MSAREWDLRPSPWFGFVGHDPGMTDRSVAGEPVSHGSLPYGPLMTAALRPLQRGFLILNRGFMAPLMRAGFGWLLGNPLTGCYLVLVTRGRRTGLRREAPLGYVIRDGDAFVVAGYGRTTPWYRNLLDAPAVEVILPTRRFRAHATAVEDPAAWAVAYRDLIRSFGLIGRGVAGDVHALDDDALWAEHGGLPVVRLSPNKGEPPLVAGAFDPGGRGWMVSWVLSVAIGVLAARALRHARG
jgi:deazaflavin-dependent oxidoreductase (nitroreductase family)